MKLQCIESELKAAGAAWPDLSSTQMQTLKSLIANHQLSVIDGHVQLLEGRLYVTHPGLLRLAATRCCSGIHAEIVTDFCDPVARRWVIKATVFKTPRSKGFVGYGDADPSNVSSAVRGAEMRVAETRAVNRALRKAYGIGICSVEELGASSGPLPPAAGQTKKPAGTAEPANGNCRHPLRDRLCLLIRQHQLDPTLVKAYAADYCDVAELRQASRQQVATFIKHLAEYAHGDREGLLYHLNSYREALVQIANASTPAEPENTAGAA